MVNVLVRNGANPQKLNLYKKVRENLSVAEQIQLAKDLGMEPIIPDGFDVLGNPVQQNKEWLVTGKAKVMAKTQEEAIAIAKEILEFTATETLQFIMEEDNGTEEDYEEDN